MSYATTRSRQDCSATTVPKPNPTLHFDHCLIEGEDNNGARQLVIIYQLFICYRLHGYYCMVGQNNKAGKVERLSSLHTAVTLQALRVFQAGTG